MDNKGDLAGVLAGLSYPFARLGSENKQQKIMNSEMNQGKPVDRGYNQKSSIDTPKSIDFRALSSLYNSI